jgi:hypothetical protein
VVTVGWSALNNRGDGGMITNYKKLLPVVTEVDPTVVLSGDIFLSAARCRHTFCDANT